MSTPRYGRHEGPAYIASGSASATFYRSDPYVSQPGEPVESPLKAKYMVGGTAPKFNKHSDNNAKSRVTIRKESAGEPRVMLMHDANRGKTVMMTVSQFLSAYPDWNDR